MTNTDIKLSLNTDLFKHYPLDQALDLVDQAGYRFITLNAVPFWDPHLDFSRADAASKTQYLAQRLQDRGIHIASAEIATNLSAWDEDERSTSVAYCLRAIDLLAPLGCRIFSVSGGGTNLFNKEDQQLLLQKSLRELSAHVDGSDMHITVDIYPGSCLENSSELLRIMDDLGLPNVRYMLCTPHVASLGEDPLETYCMAHARIGHIIIADTPLSTVTHSHLVPGDGSINFAPLFAALQQDKYAGFITIQIYTHMDDAPLQHAIRAREIVEGLLATTRPGSPHVVRSGT